MKNNGCCLCSTILLPTAEFAYPTIEKMENTLGWKVRFQDIGLVRQHTSHGGMTHEEAVASYRAYKAAAKARITPSTSVATVIAPAPATAPVRSSDQRRKDLLVLQDRAVAMSVRFGLGFHAAEMVAKTCNDTGADLETVLRQVAEQQRLDNAGARYGLTPEETQKAVTKSAAENISLEAAMQRLATGKRLAAAKKAKKAESNVESTA